MVARSLIEKKFTINRKNEYEKILEFNHKQIANIPSHTIDSRVLGKLMNQRKKVKRVTY